jgi:hypothetical protein
MEQVANEAGATGAEAVEIGTLGNERGMKVGTNNGGQALMEKLLQLVQEAGLEPGHSASVLLDASAAIMATAPHLRKPSALRDAAEEARKRIIRVTRLHQDYLDRAIARRNGLRTMSTRAPGDS